MDNFDQNHVNNQEWKDAEAVKEAETTLRRDSIQKLFDSYYFNKKELRQPPQPVPNPNKTKELTTTGGVPTTNGNEEVMAQQSSSKKSDAAEG